MGIQVIRVESYGKGDLAGIGSEQLRGPKTRCKNTEIDSSRTHLNTELIPAGGSLRDAWERCLQETNAVPYNRRGSGAFQQMIITSGQEWFAERFGWDPGNPVLTGELQRWAQESVDWAVSQIGWQGTAANIMAATLHLDEKTPHIHISYLPLTDWQRRKVLQKDAQGKVLRNGKGSALAQRDPETGRTVYELVKLPRPRIAKTDFWALYGGAQSEAATGMKGIAFSLLQDSYHETVGRAWGLERGERGSGRRHKTFYQHQVEQKQNELVRLEWQRVRAAAAVGAAKRHSEAAQKKQADAEAKARQAQKAEAEARTRAANREQSAEARARRILRDAEQTASQVREAAGQDAAQTREEADREVSRLREAAEQEVQERAAVLDQREGRLDTREASIDETKRLLREREQSQEHREQEWLENRDARIREFTEEAGDLHQQVQEMTVAVDLGTRLEDLGRPFFFGKWIYTADERRELVSAAVEGQAKTAAARSAPSLREDLQKAERALAEEQRQSAGYLDKVRSLEEKTQAQEVEIARLRPMANETGTMRQQLNRLQAVQKGLHSLVCGLLGVIEDTRQYWEPIPILGSIFGLVQKWLKERTAKLQLDDQGLEPMPASAPESLLSHRTMWREAEQEKKRRERQAAQADQTRQSGREPRPRRQTDWER